MTDALITELAKISSLRVISRTSVMRFKDTTQSISNIAQELGVDVIMEGSVFRADNRVRINGQLIEAATQRHLWADDYERDLRDILRLQSEVARTIARQVHAELSPDERNRLKGRRKIEPASHDAYIRGRYYYYQWNQSGFEKAIQSFRQAADLDPTSAEAYAGLADCYLLLSVLGFLPPDETGPPARAAARKAVELDESLGQARTSLGSTQFVLDWDWAAAEDNILRGIELAPNNVDAFLPKAILSVATGRPDEGIAAAAKACDIDPLTPTTSNHFGYCLLLSRRYDEASAQFAKTVRLAPDFHYPHAFLACIHALCNRASQALAEVELGLSKLKADDGYALSMFGWVLGKLGRKEQSYQSLQRILQSEQGWPDPTFLATVHAGLGEVDQAIAQLKAAHDRRSPQMIYLATHPLLDDLRNHPEFAAILRSMRFPQHAL